MLRIENQTEQPVRVIMGEKLALRWAVLLCGREIVPDLGVREAEFRVPAWAAEHLDIASGKLSSLLQRLPEPFMTTGFQHEVKSFHARVDRVRHICSRLRQGELTFVDALSQVSQAFNEDEDLLLRWKDALSALSGFERWLPSFERAFEYLGSAFPTPEENLEAIRKDLLAAAAEPQRFLDSAGRERFDQQFEEFKQGYVDYYQASHEDAVHIFGNQGRMESKVDHLALRNLELLSELDHGDRSYLNRVRALGMWVQSHHCDLPVLEILATHPRCYCNFNPAAGRHLANSVDHMNEAISQGIDYFRSVLRKCRMAIIQELKDLRAGDECSRQIAALLSRGPMIPLKPESIGILNAIMLQHSNAFRAGNR